MQFKGFLKSAAVAGIATLVFSLVPPATAQMNGWSNGQETGCWGGMSGNSGMSGMNGMGGMGSTMGDMWRPVVGPDGTAYVFRTSSTPVNPGSFSQVGTELVAIDPSDGRIRWSVPVDGWMVSKPVVAGDGRIFLTTSGSQMGYGSGQWGGMMGGGYGQNVVATPRLLIIGTDGNSAAIIAQIELDSRVLSEPQLAPDTNSGYLVYVNGSNMGWGYSNGSSAPSGSFLYAFLPNGQLKFKVQLSQW